MNTSEVHGALFDSISIKLDLVKTVSVEYGKGWIIIIEMPFINVR